MKHNYKFILFVFLAFIAFSVQGYSGSAGTGAGKKGFKIWLWMGAHASWNERQWDSVLSGFKSAGIYGLLIQTDTATLIRMIPVARKYGIVVEKWFIALLNNDTSLIKHHPDWYVVNREGKSSVTDPAYVNYYRFLCPAQPGVREYLKSSLDPFLRIPGLSGIHLDYIRYPDVILPRALWSKYGIVQDREYPPYDYCYCPVCREKYRMISGIDPGAIDSPDTLAGWKQFRYDQVTSLVKELAEYCHLNGKMISAAVFPGPSLAMQLVRQEWNRWPLDEVMPMLYHNFYDEVLGWIMSETTEGVRSLQPTVPLYSGLYIPALSPRDLKKAFIKSRKGGARGVCLFNYESMTREHWKKIKTL